MRLKKSPSVLARTLPLALLVAGLTSQPGLCADQETRPESLSTAQAWGPRIDLLTIYRMALEKDAAYLAAQAGLEATQHETAKARAGLLPILSASLGRSRNHQETESTNFFGQQTTTEKDYTYDSRNLSLRQPLFRFQNWAQYQQAQAQVEGAEAGFVKDGNDLVLRSLQAYLDLLLANDGLELARSQHSTYENHLKFAERAFRAGSGTLTDIQDVKSRLDRAKADLIAAENQVQYAREAILTLTQARADHWQLRPFAPEQLPRQLPEPATVESWLERAEAANPNILSASHALEAAQHEVRKQFSGHLPTVDLVASRQQGSNESPSTLDQKITTRSVGVQVSLPLFSGGYATAATQQAQASREKARHVLEATRREVFLKVRTEFNNVKAGIAEMAAFEQLVRSGETSLQGNRKGVEAGSRSFIDLLNAERDLVSARFELAKSRAKYVMSTARLHALTSPLQENFVLEMNRWLAP